MSTLTGKTALVTGTSRGIGRATAVALAAAGARVVVHYGRGADEAKSVVDQISASSGRADAVGVDLAAPNAAHALAAEVRRLVGERLDIVAANAGTVKTRTIESMTVEDFDTIFAVNVRAPYFLVQQLLPMLGSGSSVVFLSSLSARAAAGIKMLSAYGATKGAIDAMVKHFAFALGERGIRVNAVAPGFVETGMAKSTKTEEGRAMILGLQTLKRIAQPPDVASVVVFLASDDARWIQCYQHRRSASLDIASSDSERPYGNSAR